jgi:hypothetical protein
VRPFLTSSIADLRSFLTFDDASVETGIRSSHGVRAAYLRGRMTLMSQRSFQFTILQLATWTVFFAVIFAVTRSQTKGIFIAKRSKLYADRRPRKPLKLPPDEVCGPIVWHPFDRP